jgi:hypothetical protein
MTLNFVALDHISVFVIYLQFYTVDNEVNYTKIKIYTKYKKYILAGEGDIKIQK